jgi:23S rRNA (cytosine1962-C5)-methyltransferase
MEISAKVVLQKEKSRSLQRFHPWIFSGAIARLEGSVSNGCWVEVLDYHGQALGYGHYQDSSIAIRILQFGGATPDSQFWSKRIEQAVALRRAANLPSSQTNAFRLVHGEGDGLPGLIVDYYNGMAVVQAHSLGMHKDRHAVATALTNVLGIELSAIYYKPPADAAHGQESIAGEYISGAGEVPHTIHENGHAFLVDWAGGQKTGFFLDQRGNRKLLGHYSKKRTVLNTFCYSGGFSIYALANGAKLVHSVDASERAISLARKNITLNGYDPQEHSCYAMDTFNFLKGKEDVYDLIVLDPPAFAKHRSARHQAVKGYQRLNAAAFRAIKQEGIVFTFSCSQVVDKQLFYDTVVSSAIQAGREVSVLHHLSQPEDHPVSLYHPEGEYLKGLVLYVR